MPSPGLLIIPVHRRDRERAGGGGTAQSAPWLALAGWIAAALLLLLPFLAMRASDDVHRAVRDWFFPDTTDDVPP